MGYHRAGFEVTGVDIRPQPRYPFTFHHADALEFVAAHGREYDVIHASPPCQAYSFCTPAPYKPRHPDLIAVVRKSLQATDRPFVIENVAGARRLLNTPILLCGSMFGLRVWRHRYFESLIDLGLTFSCNHSQIPVLVTGTTRRKGYKRVDPPISERRQAMGIDWMTTAELDQAIPPAYTEFIGREVLKRI